MTETDLQVHDLSRLKPEKFNGSIAAYYPEHPRAINNSGMVHWAVLVMENDLGRYLTGSENVRHLDRDRTNCDFSNLILETPYAKIAVDRQDRRPRTNTSPCKRKQHKKSNNRVVNHRRGKQIAWPEKEVLAKLVWECPRSKLCKKLGVALLTLNEHCKKQEITVPKVGHWHKRKIDWPDAETLSRMLRESIPMQVAKSLGMSVVTLTNHCRTSNIHMPTQSERWLMEKSREPWADKDTLVRLLKSKSVGRLARDLGVSDFDLRHYCELTKIPTATRKHKKKKKSKRRSRVRKEIKHKEPRVVKTFDVEPAVQMASKFQIARDSLPENQRDIYDALVTDYRFHALSRTGRAYVCYAVLADLVRAGWILSEKDTPK